MNGFTGRSGPVMRCAGGEPAAGPTGGWGGGGGVGGGGGGGGAGGARGAGGAGGTGGRGDAAGAGLVAATSGPAWRGVAGAAAAACGLTGKTLLHTAQRARTPPGGTLAGSTRYTVSHDGQVTFTLRSRYRGPPSSSSGSWRRSTTNTDPGCVLA